ncbi:ankyrin repeat-containing domain protein [Aspergillus insuetus]
MPPSLRSLYALPPELIALIAESLCANDKVNLLRAFPLLLPAFPRSIILERDGHRTEPAFAVSPEYNSPSSLWDTSAEDLGEEEEVELATYPGAGLEQYVGCPGTDTDTDTDVSTPRSPIYIPSLAAGSRAGTAYEGNNMLHVLAQTGDLQLLRALTAIHNSPPLPIADINHLDRTPISLACEAGHLSTVKFLADFNPSGLINWDAQDIMPISWAAREGHTEIVRYVLSRPEVTRLSPTYWFHDPACVAVREGRADVVGALVEAMNMRIDKVRTESLAKSRHGAAEVDGEDGDEEKDEAVEIGRIADRCSWLPLRYAINEGYTDIVKKLLQLKTLDISGQQGMPWRKTPLFLACRRGYARIVELLLAKDSSKINTKNPSGKTALARAREDGKMNIVELLTVWGAEE